MNTHQKISLDLNNLFKPGLANGIDNLTQLEPEFKDAHAGVMALKRTGQLPFSSLPEDPVMLDSVIKAAANYKDIDNVIVLGIGGSALGTSAIYQALNGTFANSLRQKQKGTDKGLPRLYVADFVEPASLTDLCQLVKGDKNLFVLISKSGDTSETLAQSLFIKKFFGEQQKGSFFYITDPQKGFLRELVTRQNLPSLPVPPGVGGRFSVFTPVGLFPLAVAGVNIAELLDGARHMEQACQSSVLAQNPAGLIAMVAHKFITSKNTSQVVMLPYGERLKLFSDWFAQLWGESLGKRHTVDGREVFTGTTPIKSVGVTDQHSQLQLYLEGPRDKIIFFVEVDDFGTAGLLAESDTTDERITFLSGKSLAALQMAEKAGTEESLRENGRPNATIKLSMINEFQMGQLFHLFMNVIPYMGTLMHINAFDQPAVERIKKFTFGLMERKGFEDYKDKLKDVAKKKELVF